MQRPDEAFQKLTSFLNRFDALEFLCQASMTCLFSPEGTFHSESDEIQIWGRRIEFAAGYYTARGSEGSEPVTGWHLEEFQTLVDRYYDALDIDHLSRDGRGIQESSSVMSARIHSMHVRGEAYPHQFEEYARELYGEHDAWFIEKLGFTISDAYSLAEGMTTDLNARFNLRGQEAESLGKRLIEEDSSWQNSGLSETEAIRSAQIQLFFGQAKDIFRFSKEDIVNLSGLSAETCEAILSRLSQRPGYRNSFYPDTFQEPAKAAWDYNTISERPLITDGSHYWAPIPYLLKQNLYYTFFFDLMGDPGYKSTFEKARGSYLERKVATYLKRVFPNSSVLLNPKYPNGNEFCDVLVLHDGKIVVVQCKGKSLTRGGRIGESVEAIKSDVQKAIKNAVDQGVRCRQYLETNNQAQLVHDGVSLAIDMRAVSSVDLMAVTFMPLHMMATRIRSVEEDLAFPHAEFPAWAIALGDLDIVTDICHSPARLLQYIKRRLMLEQGDIRVHGDEMDLLAFFLTQGLWMKDERFSGSNLLGIAGFSNDIDEYVFRRWDCGEDVAKPQVSRPDGFYPLVDAVEKLTNLHKTDCAITLLELSGVASEKFVTVVEATKAKTLADGQSHSVSLQGEDGVTGISFQSFPSTCTARFANERTEGFGFIKKYAEKLDSWVALGWSAGGSSPIDRAFWLGFPWEHNETLEPIATELRKERKPF